MKAKLKIVRATTSTVNTKKGQAEKHNFLVDGGKGEFWADCFANATTAEWLNREGEEQEMELKSREYQGKTYWNIIVPKQQDLVMITLKRIEEKLDKFLGISPPAESTEETPEANAPDDVPW